MCASWVDTTKEKEKGKELVSRAECSAIGRHGAPTKVQEKETKAKGNGGSHPRRPPRHVCCGSTSHFLRDCPSKNSQHVREVVADEELEVLFIGHTEAITCEGDGHEHECLKVGTRRERKVPCKPPPGLGARRRDTSTENSFSALMVQDDNEEIHNVQTVNQGRKLGRLGHRRHHS